MDGTDLSRFVRGVPPAGPSDVETGNRTAAAAATQSRHLEDAFGRAAKLIGDCLLICPPGDRTVAYQYSCAGRPIGSHRCLI